MIVNVMSDIHLEFFNRKEDLIEVGSGDVLLLSGDILVAKHFCTYDINGNVLPYNKKFELNKSIYEEFLTRCSNNYNKIFWILGNHEYYGSDIPRLNEWFPRYIAKRYPKIKILNNQGVDICDNWAIFGSTLWTNYNNENPQDMVAAQNTLNDFKKITFDGNNLLPINIVDLHTQSIRSIGEAVKTNPNKSFIIMTHHAPSYKSVAKNYQHSNINAAYVNNYDDFILSNKNIKYWVHGHTHINFNYTVGECNVLCNPYGYHGYESVKDYSAKMLNIKS